MLDLDAEWLETDGLGGFSSGTVSGLRTRRYHAVLVAAADPPVSRFVLVAGFEVWLRTQGRRMALTSHRYAPDVVYPEGARRIIAFARDPWPTWTFELDDGRTVTQMLVALHGAPVVRVSWRLSGRQPLPAQLEVRPLIAVRDFHALTHENPNFDFEPQLADHHVRFRPYAGLPGVRFDFNGSYLHSPDWYRNFLYEEERQRGLDYLEDLATPGTFEFDLDQREATLVVSATDTQRTSAHDGDAREWSVPTERDIEQRERSRRSTFPNPLARAADAYVVTRGNGESLIAGYPWFGDWGRDTFIAMRGLCLARNRLADARLILLAWADSLSLGMLPNRFPDHGETPEYNSVDAPLWYIVVAAELIARSTPSLLSDADRSRLESTVLDIVHHYCAGTRHSICLDTRDGLLRAGQAGVQLTWMDAKVGDSVVTPRIGKPVEVEALWLNALAVAARIDRSYEPIRAHAWECFEQRFWNESAGCLYDVIDVDHQDGKVDPAVRPNQILAIGGLPQCIVSPLRAGQVVDRVERSLLTPMGLRTLDPNDPRYKPRYAGDIAERDTAYHQGTVWPWLMGAFIEAWIRVRDPSSSTYAGARARYLRSLEAHLDHAGLGHISEIADGDPPHTPRGCPFQAWSLGEFIRIQRVLDEAGR